MAESRIEHIDVLQAFRALRGTLQEALLAADALVKTLEALKHQPMPATKAKRGPFAPFRKR